METYPAYAIAESAVLLTDPMCQGSAINSIDKMPLLTWDQWWTADQLGFPGSSEAAGGIPYAQQEPHLEDFIPNHISASSNEMADSIIAQGYPTPPQASEPISSKDPPSNSDRRRDSPPTQLDKRKRKRKRNTIARAPAESSKRGSLENRESKAAAGESGGTSKNRRSIDEATTINRFSSEYKKNDYARKAQERNRIAANKFRIKKREDARKLTSEKEEMERINRDLYACMTDLTLEVYNLKMQLLQHTDCNCALIQEFIANEAHRYIQGLGDQRQPHQPRQHEHCNV